MPEPQLDQTDTILLLLAADTSDPSQRFRCDGITRLEKMIFLLEQETDFEKEIQEPFTFEPYHYGPYSAAVYSAVDFLKAMRLLEERQIDVSSGLDVSEQAYVLDADDLNEDPLYVERQLMLTEDGKAVAKVLSTRVSPEGKKALADVKERFGAMPLRQLLRYVYGRYPKFAEKSRIRDSL
jgi:uncharacterized protein YwgA